MESTELVRLERIALSLPCREIQMERCDGVHGEIFYAYGADSKGLIHGVWGSCGVAGGPVEFTDKATVAGVRQVLVDAAHQGVEQMISTGVLRA